MKSVLISIKPKWCELIANGQKTVEVRKTRPKLETPFKVYIYRTKGYVRHLCGVTWWNMPVGGNVIGEFVCDDINTTDVVHGNEEVGWYVNNMHAVKGSCLDEHDILCYCPKESTIYGWHISDLVIYDEPKELDDFEIECKGGCDIPYVYYPPCDNCRKNRLTRPPQSWCYVEERKMRE